MTHRINMMDSIMLSALKAYEDFGKSFYGTFVEQIQRAINQEIQRSNDAGEFETFDDETGTIYTERTLDAIEYTMLAILKVYSEHHLSDRKTFFHELRSAIEDSILEGLDLYEGEAEDLRYYIYDMQDKTSNKDVG